VPTDFDPGYGLEPFATLCREYPDDSVYPGSDFRVEWGPLFHRGRLDGTARVLVIGQDPAQHEAIARRILIGEAGHRLQGFLFKLGIDRSYVLINTYLYSLFGSTGPAHQNDPDIAAYRGRWLSAIFDSAPIEAVVALGTLADHSWKTWKATADGQAVSPGYVHITHPTQPESAAGNDAAKHAQLITGMLHNWNQGLDAISPSIAHPDTARPLEHYGNSFAAGDRIPIPLADMPAGLPTWMASDDGWAARGTGATRRATITVQVPADAMPS
jgi:Uracil DNA glycosylase superfamily